ncbi:MAG: hypothetical protein IT317_05540 [Anaerolineales bacterium]|nr:hypothetical protein [Anaerolineales bacterium]
MQRILLVLTLALTLIACGASPQAVQTAVAQTQQAQTATAAVVAQTATAGAPTNSPEPTDTQAPTATATTPPTDTPTPTEPPTDTPTPKPSHTPEPTDTATPAVTNTKAPPAATFTATTPPTQPGPDFVTTAKAVKAQVESIGGQIDLALQVGYIDCVQLVNSYFYITSRRELVVPPNLAGPYATYQSGIDKFTDRVHDINDNCVAFLADPSQAGGIPQQQWGTARLGVNESSEILRQAILDAGGTP